MFCLKQKLTQQNRNQISQQYTYTGILYYQLLFDA